MTDPPPTWRMLLIVDAIGRRKLMRGERYWWNPDGSLCRNSPAETARWKLANPTRPARK